MDHVFGSHAGDALFTGVIQITSFCDGLSMGHRIPHGTPVIINQPALPLGRITLYDYQIAETEGILMLTSMASSWHCGAPVPASGLMSTVLELCAGFGGMGIGASFLGGEVVASVDHNALSVRHSHRNTNGLVLPLDLTKLDSAKLIHQNCPPIGTVTLGFPCQPFSNQGSRLGVQDARFAVFWAGLRIIFLTQPQSAILECVQQVESVQEITEGLKALADAMQWTVMTTLLHLHERWPSRRSRWWALLQPSVWDHLPLESWLPTSTFPTVGHLVETWGTWTLPEEQALSLTPEEHQFYFDRRFGNDKRHLSLEDQAPALLHSYGNALRPCPCSCRMASFRLDTLLKGGLRGFCIDSIPLQCLRHLHPREAAYLLGVPANIIHDEDVRAALSLLGLIASPIQMVWVYSHLRFNAAVAISEHLPEPEYWLQRYCADLVCQAAPRFRPAYPAARQWLHIIDDTEDWWLPCTLDCTVLQLLQASRMTLRWNEAGCLLQNGSRLALDQLLDGSAGPIHLQRSAGPIARAPPAAQLLISIQHFNHQQVHILHGGQFLFEAMRNQGIDLFTQLLDEQGQVHGADERVWRPMRLFVPQALPGSSISPVLLGTGPGDLCLGLSSLQLWTLLLDLLPRSPRPIVLVHPHDAHQLHGRLDFGIAAFGLASKSFQACLLCAFVSAAHWALLWGQPSALGFHWIYFDGLPGSQTLSAWQLAGILSHHYGIASWTFTASMLMPQCSTITCGTITYLTARALLGLSWISEPWAVLQLHHQLRHLGSAAGLFGLGPNPIATQLAALLATKGVPCQQAPERADAAVRKLGAVAVQSALQSPNPWKDLKQLASKPGCNFQFVLKGELQQYIDQRAADQHGANISSKKKSRKPASAAPNKPWCPDPSHLQLQAGLFVDAEDD